MSDMPKRSRMRRLLIAPVAIIAFATVAKSEASVAKCENNMSYRQLSVLASEDLPSCFFEGCDIPDSGDPLTAKCPSTAPCAVHFDYLMSAFQDDPCNGCPDDLACWAHDRSPPWPVANLTGICRSGPALFTNPGKCCAGNITQVGHWWYQTLCNSTVWKVRFRSDRYIAPEDWEEYRLPVNDTFYLPSNSSYNCTLPAKINRDTGIGNVRDPVEAILLLAANWVCVHAGFRRAHDRVHSWKRELVGAFATGLVDLLTPFGTLLLWKDVFGYSDMSWSGLQRLWIFLCTTPSANAFLVLAALYLSREKTAGRMNRAGMKIYGLVRRIEARWRAVTGKESPGRRTREKDEFELDEDHESHISGDRAKQFLANWALIKATSTVMSMSVGIVAIAYTTHQGVVRGLFADPALASYTEGPAVVRLYAGSMICLIFFLPVVASLILAALVHLYRSRFQKWLVDNYLIRVLFDQLTKYYKEREWREDHRRPPLAEEAEKDRKMAYKQRLTEAVARRIVKLKASEDKSAAEAQRRRRYLDQSRKKAKMVTVKYLERFQVWLQSKDDEEAPKITTDIEKSAGIHPTVFATGATSPVKGKLAVVVEVSNLADQSPLDGRRNDSYFDDRRDDSYFDNRRDDSYFDDRLNDSYFDDRLNDTCLDERRTDFYLDDQRNDSYLDSQRNDFYGYFAPTPVRDDDRHNDFYLDSQRNDFYGYFAPAPVGEDGASTSKYAAPTAPSQPRVSPQRCFSCYLYPTCLACRPDPSQIVNLTAVGGYYHSPDDDNPDRPVAPPVAPPVADPVAEKPPRPSLVRRVLASWPFRPLIIALFDWLDKAREDLGMKDYWPDREKYQALHDEVVKARAKGLMPLPEQSYYFTTGIVVIYFVGLWCFFSAMWEVAGERLCMPDIPFSLGISTAFSFTSFTISTILAQFSGMLA